MRVKDGFHWKTIEQKPDNWEILRQLIQDGQNVEDKTKTEDLQKYWKTDRVYVLFVESFPEMKTWIELPQKKDVKKKQMSRKESIHQKVEDDLIKKELSNIQIDPKTLYPVHFRFSFPIFTVLCVLRWNYQFFHFRKAPNKIVLLEAILSLGKIHSFYHINIETNPILKKTITHAMNCMEQFMKPEMFETLFEHPKLLVETMVEKKMTQYQLHPEQREVLNKIMTAITTDNAILLGNQMPTGTGKTFLTIPLAKRMSSNKTNKKTLIFSCSNELVCQDVASTALLADDLHLWLAKLIQDSNGQSRVLLRPYKRCFPAKWKQVYKKTDIEKNGSIQEQWTFYVKATGKTPDLIVTDLEASLELLKASPLLDDPFVAYIDEFISDSESNEIMAQICHYLPKQTVILSSILPSFDRMDAILSDFQKRHCTDQNALHRISTTDVAISCAIVDQDGYLVLPHFRCTTKEDVSDLIRQMRTNPRIRRLYTPQHIYYWSKSVCTHLEPEGLDFKHFFPTIWTVHNRSMTEYAVKLLEFLENHSELLPEFKEYRPRLMHSNPDRDKIFTEQASWFDGKTLIMTNRVLPTVLEMVKNLIPEDLTYREIESKNDKLQEQYDVFMKKMEARRQKKNEKAMEMFELQEMKQINLSFPKEIVINSKEHFEKFHPDDPVTVKVRSQILLPKELSDVFYDRLTLCLIAGIGFYSNEQMTDFQRNAVMSLYKDLGFLVSDKTIVFGTNLPHLTNIFIDRDFALSASVPVLYQLIGRVGRMGRSYHANVVLNNKEGVDKIMSFHNNRDDEVDIDQLFMNSKI